MSSEWDDLFAAAAGETNNDYANDDNDNDDDYSHNKDLSSTQHRKKKKHKKNSFHVENNDDNKMQTALYQAFLESRLDPCTIDKQNTSFPRWLCIGSSLCTKQKYSHFCSGYVANSDSNQCKKCSLSPLYHSCTSKKNIDYLNYFSTIRDIRCCCSCIFEIMDQHDASNDLAWDANLLVYKKKLCLAYAKTSKQKANYLVSVLDSRYHNQKSLFKNLPIGEKDILNRKLECVVKATDTFYIITKKWQHKPTRMMDKMVNDDSTFLLDGIFDELVRVMNATDAIYFRLYYIQVTGCIPILGNSLKNMIHLPHPSTYFGVDNLAFNISRGVKWRDDFVNQVFDQVFHGIGRDDQKSSILEKLKEFLEPLGLHESVGDEVDPLTFLHHNRFNEGLLVFRASNWIYSNQAYEQTTTLVEMEGDSSLNDSSEEQFYKKHETISSPILSEWRDSCRDFLCNLYGYATIHTTTLKNIKEVIRQLPDVNCIVEMGSGTGFLARLISNIGIDIDAYDIAPTPSLQHSFVYRNEYNDYHGSTPSFYRVNKGDSKYLTSFFKTNRKNAKSTALLLCYPPPQVTMAEEMLNVFRSCGGKCIIHVGEWSGLTGSLRFQDMLNSDFELINRFDCLHWGTDCAEVSIWYAKGPKDDCNVPLLPCSKCRVVESKKQCRLLRLLRYCSSKCFEGHKRERSFLLSLYNVPLLRSKDKQDDMSFNNLNHFKIIP